MSRCRGRLSLAAPLIAVALIVSGCANDPPVANFTINPNPTSGQTVTFDGSASTGGRDDQDQPIAVQRWEWDLDGNGSFEKATSSPTVSHTYEGTKTVEVSLRVVNARNVASPGAARTVVTSPEGTATAPASGACPLGTADNDACGTSIIGDPRRDTPESVAPVKQPRADQTPLFSGFFGGSWADVGHPETPAAIATGGDRVFALDRTNDVDMHDSSSLAYLGDFDVEDGSRDLAFYRDEVYVLNRDGSVQVFSPQGLLKRALRFLPLDGVLGSNERLSFSTFDVSWEEIWSTVQIGDQGGTGVVVRDARTGALKSVLLHRSGTDCAVTAYNADGSHWCVMNEQPFVQEGPYASGTSFARAGISAVPELSALVSQCRTISRISMLGLTTGRDQYREVDPVTPRQCAWNTSITDRIMGNDAPLGMRWLLQMEKRSAGDWVLEHRMSMPSSGGISVFEPFGALPYPAPDIEYYAADGGSRSWQPQDATSNNDRDIAYRPRESKVDWSGTLTENPTDWLRSPNGTEDKCLHYLVSDADIYVAGYRGERWYELARDLTQVQLIYDGTVIKTSTASEGDFCIDTRRTYNGKQIVSGTRMLEVKAILSNPTRSVSAVNENLRIDNAAPTGFLVAPETLVKGTLAFRGDMEDPHSGPRSWVFEVLPPGGSWWEVCTGQPVPDVPNRYRCEWPTGSGQFPDGTYQVRARMTDNATDGGNTAWTSTSTVEVDNTTVEDGGTPRDVVDQALEDGWEETGQPETAFELPGPDDEEFTVAQTEPNHATGYATACSAGDEWGESFIPTYEAPVPGQPPLNPSPEAALVQLFATAVMPPVPPTAFQQAEQASDYAVYVAKLNGQTRAFVVVEKDPGLGWVVGYYEGCSRFPEELVPVGIP